MGGQLLIGEVVRNAARAVPSVAAAHLGDRTLTFGELDRLGNQHAAALAAKGIGRGDRVVFRGDTSLDVLPLFVGLAKLGAVFAPLNPHLSDEEAAGPIATADPKLVVTDESLRDLGDHAARCPAEERRVELDESDPHVLFFTSGSTGEAKGVVLSHRANWLRTFSGALLEPRGGTVCMFPLFHMAGWTIALGCWQARTTVTFVPTPTAEALLAEVDRRRAERLYAIPAVWSRILEADRSGYDLSCLRLADTGTSATPPELLAAVKDAFPWSRSRVFYGSTEAGPGTMLADADLADHPGSVGLPQPGVEVRLADNGEVQMRGAFLFDGYYDDPEATAAALDDGWYRTGDVGVLDADGYLSIVGRAREVIRTGGETVAPAEVEAVLAEHPDVAEVAVVGVPDPEWGEIVCAVIVLPHDAAAVPDVDDLHTHCGDALARYKHPRRVEVVDALPRTAATGQVQRTLLVERLR